MQTHLFGSKENNSQFETFKKGVPLTTQEIFTIKFHTFTESAIIVGTLNSETKSSNKFI
jgi:hypothetical protein